MQRCTTTHSLGKCIVHDISLGYKHTPCHSKVLVLHVPLCLGHYYVLQFAGNHTLTHPGVPVSSNNSVMPNGQLVNTAKHVLLHSVFCRRRFLGPYNRCSFFQLSANSEMHSPTPYRNPIQTAVPL